MRLRDTSIESKIGKVSSKENNYLGIDCVIAVACNYPLMRNGLPH